MASKRVATTALDMNSKMLRHVEARSPQHGLQVRTLQADMRSFQLQGPPVDMAACLLGTFTHLMDHHDALAALRCAAAALAADGLLLLELPHPGDLFSGALLEASAWERPLPPELSQGGTGGSVVVEWGQPDDVFDCCTQVLHRTVTLSVVDESGQGWEVEEVVPARQYTLPELRLLAELAGLQVVKVLGSLELVDGAEVEVQHPDAFRLVLLLQPSSAGGSSPVTG